MQKVNYVETYLSWLRQNIDEAKISDNTYRITFPFTDINNTSVEVYIIKKPDGTYTITDDGYTFGELEFSGFDYTTPRRKEIINSIADNYGVSIIDDNELSVECSEDMLAFKKHLLIQCIIKISDLCLLSTSNIKTLFNEDVESYFDDIDVRYLKDVSFIGKSRLQSNYDFGIGKTKRHPERIIKLINNLDSQNAKSTIFSWEDVKDLRPKDAQLITIINDKNKSVSKSNLNALREYGIITLPWSQREEKNNIEILTA